MKIIKPSVTLETPVEHLRDYLTLIERYGRTCHKSEEGISPGSADPFIRKYMIDMGHESVLEHCSVTARFICDRSASHQLVRHRLGSYSQESQRAVDYSRSELCVICPPRIESRPEALTLWTRSVELAEKNYRLLVETGVPPEDARSLLPNCVKTEVVATFNLRQWRHVFIQRALNPRAQWQIRELTADLLRQMHGHLPVVFEDLQSKILYKLVFEPGNETGE